MLRSSIISRHTRWLLGLLAAAALLGAPFLLYSAADPERLELDDTVRSHASSGRFVHLSDGYTHYEMTGAATGGVVILAAGYSVPYYIWDPTFRALASAGFTVLRYDYYGRGLSDRPDVPYSDDFYVRQLAELVESQHATGPLDLVGLSFGGTVITSFADRYPGRVRSLVYVDPGFRTPGDTPLTAGIPPVWNFFTAVFDERGWADDQLGDFLHPERFPDWPARYREQMQYKGFRRARLSEIVTNASVDEWPQVQRVGSDPRPVLVIWGKQDPNVPFEQSADLMAVMPRARLVAVDRSGHLPQWEQPQAVHSALIDFLHGVDGDSGSLAQAVTAR